MNTKTPESEITEARNAIDALYTPLDEALELLRERRADEKLRAAVADFHRVHPPDFLPDVPCAFWTRHITTPNHEFELFASTVSATDLQPLCLESTEDIFVAHNPDKYRLCRPFFEVHSNRFRGLHIMKKACLDQRRLCDLKLSNGMSLPAFHHALLRCAFPGFEDHLRDYSKWFSTARRNECFYLHTLSLFICNGILFENVIAADSEEWRFARMRFIPSFATAIEIFGVQPLVVRLLPPETENDEYWRSHPGTLYPHAMKLIYGNL